MSVNVEKTEQVFHSSDALTAYAVARVNLLPPEIEAERAFRRTQVVLGVVTVAVAGLVAGGFVLASAATANEQEALDVEQARTSQLLNEQAQYAEVPQVLGQVEAAEAAQATAMATDVDWYDYLNRLSASYPKGVWLKDMNIVVATTPATAVTGADLTPTIGTIQFNGVGAVHSDVAAWLDSLETIEGFSNPTYSTAQRTDLDGNVVVEFTSQVDVGPEALSTRFNPKDS